jgi:hypothetical protein
VDIAVSYYSDTGEKLRERKEKEKGKKKKN